MESLSLLPTGKVNSSSYEQTDEGISEHISANQTPHHTSLQWLSSRLGCARRNVTHRRCSRVVVPFSCAHLLRCLVRTAVLVTLLFIAVSLGYGILNPSYSNPPRHYKNLERRVATSLVPGRGNVNKEKVFIAANIINQDLIQGSWGDSLLSLIDLLGEENVFVSIYENDSGLGTSSALRNLQDRLACNSSVVTGQHVPLSEFPTVQLPNGEVRVQRLTYLAELRNRLLWPLNPAFAQLRIPGFRSAADIQFDKILFLNDVIFSPLDAVQLLFSTNADSGQAEYRAACAIDFVQLFKLYDTFVVRDTDGYGTSLQYYPWFTHMGSGTSRADVVKQSDAVRVRSCWGGMAAFDADLFQPRTPVEQSRKPEKSLSSANQTHLSLQFRSDGELFWEAAECCLIFADMEVKFGMPSVDRGSGVFINPYVRVAYSSLTWKWMHFFRRFERSLELPQYVWSLMKAPEYNQRRTHEPWKMVEETIWVTDKTQPEFTATAIGGHFETVPRPAPVGGFCGERRLFVMKSDLEAANTSGSGRNWENIPVP